MANSNYNNNNDDDDNNNNKSVAVVCEQIIPTKRQPCVEASANFCGYKFQNGITPKME
jgi:hypothetical protein